MDTFSAHDIELLACRDWSGMADAAWRSLLALASGACDAPVRTVIPLVEGSLLTMPGRIHGLDTAMVKLVSMVASNGSRGLPAVSGLAILFNAETGEPCAMFDGAALTAVRTAAVTAAAVRRLSKSPRRLAILGSGVQARWHALALCSLFELSEVQIWSRYEPHAAALAARLSEGVDVPVFAVERAALACATADLIVCCTSAQQPFLRADMLPSGDVVVVAVGAYRPEMAEIDASVFRLASVVHVDDLSAVMHEAGDVIQAIAHGAIAEGDVTPIGTTSPQNARVSIFKSVGSAVEDAAVAEYLATAR